MSISVMILGESGTGKSASMRNLDPSEALLIQVIKKPLPFKSAHWKRYEQDKTGNVFVTDDWHKILMLAQKTRRKVIVLDDFQYLMANELMNRSDEKGYDKFTDIAKHAWSVLTELSKLPDDVRVYILSHVQSDEFGRSKCKTIGKMLDEKITVEGLVSIVLRTKVESGNYTFSTRNNGQDTVKSPMGMFDSDLIDNDLAQIDAAVCAYYEIPAQPDPQPTPSEQ